MFKQYSSVIDHGQVVRVNGRPLKRLRGIVMSFSPDSGSTLDSAQLKVGLCYEYGDAYPALLISDGPFWDPVTEIFDFILKNFQFLRQIFRFSRQKFRSFFVIESKNYKNFVSPKKYQFLPLFTSTFLTIFSP